MNFWHTQLKLRLFTWNINIWRVWRFPKRCPTTSVVLQVLPTTKYKRKFKTKINFFSYRFASWNLLLLTLANFLQQMIKLLSNIHCSLCCYLYSFPRTMLTLLSALHLRYNWSRDHKWRMLDVQFVYFTLQVVYKYFQIIFLRPPQFTSALRTINMYPIGILINSSKVFHFSLNGALIFFNNFL